MYCNSELADYKCLHAYTARQKPLLLSNTAKKGVIKLFPQAVVPLDFPWSSHYFEFTIKGEVQLF